MKIPSTMNRLPGFCAALVVLTACSSGGVTPSSAPAGSVSTQGRRSGPPQYFYDTVIYGGFGTLHGAQPAAAVVNVGGTFYGTTPNGGGNGDGTIYSVTASGAETVLHSFNGTDGKDPLSALVNIGGTLYGTAHGGGANDDGVVFSINTDGSDYDVLYSFSGSDGKHPSAGLLNHGGTLYGTTTDGGAYGYGTVFSITTPPSVTETVLHNFGGAGSGGKNPVAEVIAIGDTLYGDTEYGGGGGTGVVFSCTTSGSYTELHSFGSASTLDGQLPAGRLLNVNGVLFGTTYAGGAHGDGTVFSINPSAVGSEKVWYSFALGTGSHPLDGGFPLAGLTNVDGTLYGTTLDGGYYDVGTFFAMTSTGSEGDELDVGVFGAYGSGNGVNPESSLINVSGTLYGTTVGGGNNGKGTVYSIPTLGSAKARRSGFAASSL
jgi:uncharacterized repeat protein (TIGR03803 family)